MAIEIRTQNEYTTFKIREIDLKGKYQDDMSLGRIEVIHESGKSSFIHLRVGLDQLGRAHVETSVNKEELRSLRKDVMVALKNQVDTRPKTQKSLLEN